MAIAILKNKCNNLAFPMIVLSVAEGCVTSLPASRPARRTDLAPRPMLSSACRFSLVEKDPVRCGRVSLGTCAVRLRASNRCSSAFPSALAGLMKSGGSCPRGPRRASPLGAEAGRNLIRIGWRRQDCSSAGRGKAARRGRVWSHADDTPAIARPGRGNTDARRQTGMEARRSPQLPRHWTTLRCSSALDSSAPRGHHQPASRCSHSPHPHSPISK
jgi:hypothetical protein